MRFRKSFVALVAVTAVVMISGVAEAKGVQRATVTGPGLDSPITFRMNDSLDGVEAFVNQTGIYPSLFETQPNPVVQSQPEQNLGARYEVTYVMKVPGRKAAMVHQDLYPYAKPDPVTYTAPGQPTIDGGTSVGGWYVAGPSLLPLLVSKGLPDSPARPDSAAAPAASKAGSSSSVPIPLWLVLGLASLVALTLIGRTALLRRRLGRPATRTTMP